MMPIKTILPAPVAVPFECCSACLSRSLSIVFEMLNFPQIGIYLDKFDDSEMFPAVDQGLTICEDCGHIQLLGTVDPHFLYNDTFKHRTSESPTSVESNIFFSQYILKFANGRQFKRAVEIGCNDSFLLQRLMGSVGVACGIDPLWKGREDLFTVGLDSDMASRMKVVGNFVENVDFQSELGGKPDLIISSFVFEHLREPLRVIESMFDACADDALFVVMVPGTDMLLDDCRFDQLSHQHYQQFTFDSLRRMIETAGGVYVDHTIYSPVWGAIIMAFRRGPGKGEKTDFRRASRSLVIERKARFDLQLDLCRKSVRDVGDRPIYGLGAAQNFPSLAYFMGDVSFLRCILDDNPSRQNKYYPGIHVPTAAPAASMDFENSAAVLTGPDYGRTLIARGKELKFRQIILPFNII